MKILSVLLCLSCICYAEDGVKLYYEKSKQLISNLDNKEWNKKFAKKLEEKAEERTERAAAIDVALDYFCELSQQKTWTDKDKIEVARMIVYYVDHDLPFPKQIKERMTEENYKKFKLEEVK